MNDHYSLTTRLSLLLGNEISTQRMNPIKFWLIIKDDSKRTFEVCGQASNTNPFTNKTYAMQKAGMNITCVTPPVGGQNSSKDLIKFTAYSREDGLYDRLLTEYRKITIDSIEQWDDAETE
jgi:hypothetical protein